MTPLEPDNASTAASHLTMCPWSDPKSCGLQTFDPNVAESYPPVCVCMPMKLGMPGDVGWPRPGWVLANLVTC
jgi:hypothetical protein